MSISALVWRWPTIDNTKNHEKISCIPFYSKLPSSKLLIIFINTFYIEIDQHILSKKKSISRKWSMNTTKRNNWSWSRDFSYSVYQTLGCISSTYTIFKEIKTLLKDLQRTKQYTEKNLKLSFYEWKIYLKLQCLHQINLSKT